MNPSQTPGALPEQLKAKFTALTPAQRNILAQKLPLQIETTQNNRQLAILSFQDGTDQFTQQITNLQTNLDLLNEVIAEQAK